jgi:RNA polymerase sigma-70 factor, ECF subfamily
MPQLDADETEEEVPPAPVLSDTEIVERVVGGDLPVFELLMRRYNQRLFRVARSIVGNDDEAEDVVQETYVRAFEHLSQFAGLALFSTWLTKIALYEALSRRRERQRMPTIDLCHLESINMTSSASGQSGEEAASSKELGIILTKAVDELPEELRTVFTLRMIEGLDTNETAACLDLTAANIKVRLHRARSLLRERIDGRIGSAARQLYQFGGERCDRIVTNVLTRLACQ